jgi:hypothetical protein
VEYPANIVEVEFDFPERKKEKTYQLISIEYKPLQRSYKV